MQRAVPGARSCRPWPEDAQPLQLTMKQTHGSLGVRQVCPLPQTFFRALSSMPFDRQSCRQHVRGSSLASPPQCHPQPRATSHSVLRACGSHDTQGLPPCFFAMRTHASHPRCVSSQAWTSCTPDAGHMRLGPQPCMHILHTRGQAPAPIAKPRQRAHLASKIHAERCAPQRCPHPAQGSSVQEPTLTRKWRLPTSSSSSMRAPPV